MMMNKTLEWTGAAPSHSRKQASPMLGQKSEDADRSPQLTGQRVHI
ncbi:hypothetical protein [Arthrobacter sp. TE12232]